jgi:GcrA cell cycle regulator
MTHSIQPHIAANLEAGPSAREPKAHAGSGWSEDRVRRLQRLWAEGCSASEVARQLGVTRNAVIGKVHRLGLSADGRHAAARPRAPNRPPRPRRAPRSPPPPSPGAPATPAVEVLAGLVPRLEDLAPAACHWPIGNPRSDGFAFCGRRAVRGPYCEAHAAAAYARG